MQKELRTPDTVPNCTPRLKTVAGAEKNEQAQPAPALPPESSRLGSAADDATNSSFGLCSGQPPTRLWAHVLLFDRHDGFDLVPRIIGKGGVHMKQIHETTKAGADKS